MYYQQINDYKKKFLTLKYTFCSEIFDVLITILKLFQIIK